MAITLGLTEGQGIFQQALSLAYKASGKDFYLDRALDLLNYLEDYWDALLLFTGLDPDVREKQVAEYYRILKHGAKAENSLGMTIELRPVDEQIEVQDL